MPASDGCIVGASPSNILYSCVSPVITWFVVAFAIEVYDERLISPDNSTATSTILVRKIILPSRIGDNALSLTLREFCLIPSFDIQFFRINLVFTV